MLLQIWRTTPVIKRYRTHFAVFAGVATVVGLLADLAGFGIFSFAGKRMSGDFRIAIAAFSVDGVGSPTLGNELAQGLYLRMEQAFDALDPEFSVTIWGPDQVGRVKGRTADARAHSAARLADRIGADITVYGMVDTTDVVWLLAPQFYVSAESFYEFAEITGQHDMGTPLRISGQSGIAARIETSQELSARTQALANITLGLAHYSVQDFQAALDSLHSASQIEEWEEDEGKQVLYLLMGNVAAKSGELEYAEEYYQKSLALDPDYARAYVGLAGVHYLSALESFKRTLNPADVDAQALFEAIDFYRQGLEAAKQPPLSDISSKVHLGLGQCYFSLAYSERLGSFDAAVAEFSAVIQEYSDGANPRIREQAAEAHARLALIHRLSGRTEQAANEYREAASILKGYDPAREALFLQRVRELGSQTESQ